MTIIDLENLLQARSGDSVSGEDLEYDPDFAAMEKASTGKTEQQFGETVIPAEPPDWRETESCARKVLDRSHDLRAATVLANALLVQQGLVGFSESISLIKGYIEKYWETLHPELDADDDNDPTIRVNALMSLCDNSTTLNYLLHTPLVAVRSIGQFSLFDVRVANNEASWPDDADGPAPEQSLINAAFQECDIAEFEAKKSAVESALAEAKQIEDIVTQHVGAADSCNFEKLVKELQSINKVLQEQFSKRVPSEVPDVEQNIAETDADGNGTSADVLATPSGPGVGTGTEAANLNLRTRQEAILALDKICEYFERFEPSSPLPLLLKRARRLSTKSFMEIIRDISPDGLQQVESLGGMSDNSEVSGSESYSAPNEPSGNASVPTSTGDSY